MQVVDQIFYVLSTSRQSSQFRGLLLQELGKNGETNGAIIPRCTSCSYRYKIIEL